MSTPIMQNNVAAVRHLAWCLFSSPLAELNTARTLHITATAELTKWLDSLNKNPQHLLEYIQQNNHRLLGSYFECLWQYYFKYSPNTQLLAHHVQITQSLNHPHENSDQANNKNSRQTNGRKTLGELDILALIDNKPFHVELAVKFYLLIPNVTGAQAKHWIGPQTRDRLDLKLDTLNRKQLPFLHHPATQKALEQRGLGQEYESAVALKGYLFSPFNSDFTRPIESDTNLHAATNMGQWIHASDVDMILNSQSDETRWCIVEKHNWLGPVTTDQAMEDQIELLNNQQVRLEVLSHFNYHAENRIPYALMLISMKNSPHNISDLCESGRYFLVPNGWPFKLATDQAG
ncbi:MAG: hypothetical protein ACI843_001128 [Psychrobacter glaciei]|jgi:hypothetical protein